MAFSNRYNHLLLTTGNKSELAVGYCTLYGDMCGGLAVISDVPKTLVYELSRVANRRHPGAIPESVFQKPPSAELRENQLDQDSLPKVKMPNRDGFTTNHGFMRRDGKHLFALFGTGDLDGDGVQELAVGTAWALFSYGLILFFVSLRD